jgi:hypothetical protein
MDLQTAKGLLYDNPYSAYSKHDLLFSLSVIIEDDDCDTEIVFAVPADWLQTWMLRNTGKYWTFEEIQKWLQEKYTSVDSEDILEKAALERKVAFYLIDERPVLPF